MQNKVRRGLIAKAFVVMVATVAVAVTTASASSMSTWSDAEPVPGLIALNTGGVASVASVSCASAANCTIGGIYADSNGYQGFVATQTNGTWTNAIIVPGLAALNTANEAQVRSVSCSSPGNCTIGGSYRDSGGTQGFVATQTNGTWTNAIIVPGLAALNTGGMAAVTSVSCPANRNCTMTGYATTSGGTQGFVATQTNGTWTDAIIVPGLAALNTANDALVRSVSCSSPGNCTIGGSYRDSGGTQGFVATQTNGTWTNAIIVPGLAALNTANDAWVPSVSCSSPGNCTIGGSYRDSNGYQGFVATQTNGTWTNAIPVPGLAALNTASGALVQSISCTSAGNCVVGGHYTDSSGTQGFVATQTNGTWTNAIPVPGLIALTTGGSAQVVSVSCAGDMICTIGGFFTDNTGGRAFVATLADGVWSDAIPLPGFTALNTNGAGTVRSVSCASADNCTMGGYYSDSNGAQGFVASLSTASDSTTSTTIVSDPIGPVYAG